MAEEKHGFLRSMLSEGKGFTVSSKRVIGVIGFLFAMFCIGYDVCHCGIDCISPVSERLLETILIMCAALLGITSVTSIFKNKGPKNDEDNA